jgi:hypothetical protein
MFKKSSILPSTTRNASEDREPAQFWINIGYETDVPEDDGSGNRFVSLGLGIPLDQIKELDTRSKNEMYSMFQAARNELRNELLEAAEALAPGEATIVTLQVQLRRVEDAAPPAHTGLNPFLRKV